MTHSIIDIVWTVTVCVMLLWLQRRVSRIEDALSPGVSSDLDSPES
jgi:hypothetical protein